jgi:hypothetical protein
MTLEIMPDAIFYGKRNSVVRTLGGVLGHGRLHVEEFIPILPYCWPDSGARAILAKRNTPKK